jgi:3-mercaptopyruvate sulfurtransferase SseA
MIKFMVLLFALFMTAQAQVQAGQAVAVSADDAHKALSQGAFVMDVRSADRFATGHLPRAAAVPEQAAGLPLQELAALLGKAGVDSSRTMLIVGEAGDAHAHALWKRLALVTSGRVLWLVGGVQEWQMRGYALSLQSAERANVPQFLASFEASPALVSQSSTMAGSRVRTSPLLERDLSFEWAVSQR